MSIAQSFTYHSAGFSQLMNNPSPKDIKNYQIGLTIEYEYCMGMTFCL